MFEIGYTPLTLLSATFDDFRMARRRYHGLTEVIDFSINRFEEILTSEARVRHRDCVRHCRFMITLLYMINEVYFNGM
jgi:hypothetical protein